MATTSNVTLEDLEHLDVGGQECNSSLLSYPAPTPQPLPPPVQPVEQPQRQHTNRLYIGNLSPSVDEYTLLHVFSKFGKVTKLDFLFHKTGPLKGKPRGYAFLEYGADHETKKALALAHDKLLRGRKITVTYANQAPTNDSSSARSRKGVNELGRPTTLSIIKTGLDNRREPKTEAKIRLMEAKLRELEADKVPAPSSSTTGLPYHPSLPMKPPAQLPGLQPPATQAAKRAPMQAHPLPSKPPKPVPALPILPTPKVPVVAGLGGGQPTKSVTRNKLVGVVVKPRPKAKPVEEKPE